MTTTTTAVHPPRRTKPPPTARLAVFDLDRTLVPGSSLVQLGRALVERDVVARSTVARHLVSAAVFARRGLDDSRIAGVRGHLLAAAADHDREELAAVAREVGPGIADRAYPAARWLLERHRQAGDLCVLLSASPQELVESVADALGADRAVGTRAEVRDGRLTGRLQGAFCHGPGKLLRLAEELGPVELDRATAYGDSGADIPLLAACGRPVAVNPDRRLREEARARGWPVLRLT